MMELNIVGEQIQKDKISIVIPIYNREAHLLRTLHSVLEQTYRPLQLILIDNASTDNSLIVCREFQQKYQSESFNIIVDIEDRKGASYARNRGLFLCKTEYVYFFDSDDYMSSGFISSVMGVFAHMELDMVVVKTRIVTSSTNEHTRKMYYTSSPIDQILVSMLATQSVALRTSFINSINGWNVNLLTWDDWELGIRLLLACPRIEWIKTKAYHRIYIHDDSITGNNFSSSYHWLMKAIIAVAEDIQQSSFTENKKQSMLLALYFRQIILSGHLYREKEITQSDDCWTAAQTLLDVNILTQLLARAIYYYTARGGRGAWRIARLFL